jgi:hypothetical protein
MPDLAVLLMAAQPQPDPKSFDFAQSVAQQILTLATGITTLTLTFFDQFAKHPSVSAKDVLVSSWITLAGSVLFGVLTLMALTGVLARQSPDGVYTTGVRIMAGAQIVLFVIGLVLTVIAGAIVV